ncbi:MAG TPA: di-heme-cytochrome C peroxidase [Candidatus Kryptonia bacterium]|nr:di-heme-cytochrome C peroxidase [Candidatus Kryptonia bacterium]
MRITRAIALGALALSCANCTPLPRYRKVPIVYLDQGWSEAHRQTYYRTGQGTELLGMRYRWLLALERPVGREHFASPEHLAQFRFLVDDGPNRVDGLPVGFTKHFDATSGAEMLDVTCAACHTAQLNYRGRGVRIDGGPAPHDFFKFFVELTEAQLTTYFYPPKFNRFARKVLGVRYPDGKEALRREFWQMLHAFLSEGFTEFYHQLYPTADGFGRTDALGRINNELFANRLHTPANYHVMNAPVRMPHLWDIWRFDWVQWNGSVRQPMMRNIGEALGVRAPVELAGSDGRPLPPGERFQSTVRVRNLHCIESTVMRLKPPPWPEDIFGPVDRAKAARGKVVYQGHCAGCHEPHLPTRCRNSEGATDHYCCPQSANSSCCSDSSSVNGDEWCLPLIPLQEIGTDPTAATNFANFWVDASKLDPSDPALRNISAGEALRYVTNHVRKLKYDALGLDQQQRKVFDGFGRKSEVQAPLAYKARPLDGVWAAGPFLHNGSVPNLYQLLLPPEQRDTFFYTGDLEFDPHYVGFRSERFWGGFRYDTRVVGNSNAGHAFGAALTDEERWAVIEYLKIIIEDHPHPEPPAPPACSELDS